MFIYFYGGNVASAMRCDILILLSDREKARVDDWACKANRTLTPGSGICVLRDTCCYVYATRPLGEG